MATWGDVQADAVDVGGDSAVTVALQMRFRAQVQLLPRHGQLAVGAHGVVAEIGELNL
ncbi:hypothetical protein GCM10020000_34980 [Streptomyces olivoverticillatus]